MNAVLCTTWYDIGVSADWLHQMQWVLGRVCFFKHVYRYVCLPASDGVTEGCRSVNRTKSTGVAFICCCWWSSCALPGARVSMSGAPDRSWAWSGRLDGLISQGGKRDAISARNSAISASRFSLAAFATDRRIFLSTAPSCVNNPSHTTQLRKRQVERVYSNTFKTHKPNRARKRGARSMHKPNGRAWPAT